MHTTTVSDFYHTVWIIMHISSYYAYTVYLRQYAYYQTSTTSQYDSSTRVCVLQLDLVFIVYTREYAYNTTLIVHTSLVLDVGAYQPIATKYGRQINRQLLPQIRVVMYELVLEYYSIFATSKVNIVQVCIASI